MMTNNSHFPTQLFMNSAQELLGFRELQTLAAWRRPEWDCGTGTRVEASFPFEQPVQLIQAMEERYGEPGGRGLALRLGRALFHYTLQSMGEGAGLNSVTFRLLPAPRRLEAALIGMARLPLEYLGESVEASQDGPYWIWRVGDCAVCQGRFTSSAACHLTTGFLQELTSWAGGGRFYPVAETECRAAGQPACVFRIDSRPLD